MSSVVQWWRGFKKGEVSVVSEGLWYHWCRSLHFLTILRVVDRPLNFQNSGFIIFDFILCSLFVITLSFFLYRSACLKVFSLLDLVQYASEKKSQAVTF